MLTLYKRQQTASTWKIINKWVFPMQFITMFRKYNKQKKTNSCRQTSKQLKNKHAITKHGCKCIKSRAELETMWESLRRRRSGLANLRHFELMLKKVLNTASPPSTFIIPYWRQQGLLFPQCTAKLFLSFSSQGTQSAGKQNTTNKLK